MLTLSIGRAVPIAWLMLLAALAAACAGKPEVTDTGYSGTWTLGNERIHSTLSIVRTEEGYRTRLAVRSADGSFSIRVGWDGRGEEVQDGATTYDLELRTSVDSGTGRLLVECTGTPRVPSRNAFHYVDELIVEPGGLVLSAYTLERDGNTFEGEARPRREYAKARNDVSEPPGAGGAP